MTKTHHQKNKKQPRKRPKEAEAKKSSQKWHLEKAQIGSWKGPQQGRAGSRKNNGKAPKRSREPQEKLSGGLRKDPEKLSGQKSPGRKKKTTWGRFGASTAVWGFETTDPQGRVVQFMFDVLTRKLRWHTSASP